MAARIFSLLAGLAYLAFGILGLIPRFVWLPPDRLRFWDVHMVGHWGFLFGWMPVNLLHDILYLAVGGAGAVAAVTFFTAKWYSRGLFALTSLLTIVGLLPFGIDHVWGLLPLFEWNLMFHAVTAMLAYYYGFIYPLDLVADEQPPLAATA